MTHYVMVSMGLVVPDPRDDSAGKYLLRFDPADARGQGPGLVDSPHRLGAEIPLGGFSGGRVAQSSTVVPTRSDGKPDRAAKTRLL